MQRKPTMTDVARLARVGTMTVSRVLNASQHVSPETARRVREAVARLGYRPNEMARALRNSKTRTIGLLVPNLHDTFFATCAHALNMVAKQHGYTVLLNLTNDDTEHEYNEAQRMMQRHVEGLVVIPADPDRCRLGSREFQEIPVVTLDRPLADSECHVDSVLTENEAGMRQATEHLIQVHGLQRILFIGHKPELYTMKVRYAGYASAMHAAGLTPRADSSCNSGENAVSIVQTALRQPEPPQAIISANNLTTRRVLSALLSLGLRVPEQLALAGFDDLELSDLLHPALTVVRQPVIALGQRAAQILFAKLQERVPLEEVAQVVLPAELVIRHSCGCAYQPKSGILSDF